MIINEKIKKRLLLFFKHRNEYQSNLSEIANEIQHRIRLRLIETKQTKNHISACILQAAKPLASRGSILEWQGRAEKNSLKPSKDINLKIK